MDGKTNIMLKLKEIGLDSIDCTWSISGEGQLVGFCDLGKEPLGSIKCGGFLY